MIEKINESIKINKYKKLKDSIHDIVTKLNNNQWLNMNQLSKELKSFNIDIQPIVIKKMLNDWINNNSRIFDNDDYEWLYYDKDNDTVFNTLGFKKKKNLGKSRRKQIKEYNKKLKVELEKKKKNIIENVNKIEKNKILTCPIPTEIFLDLFNDLDENDIIQLKKSINDEIKNNKLKNLYETAWDFIIDKSTKSIGEGGYGYELKDKKEWEKHKPKEDWVIPDEKDIDKYIPIWYFKYGIGKIMSYDGYQIGIEFSGSYVQKRFNATSLLKNKTIRINKKYIKEPSDIDGYKPARLIDLSYGSEILHKDRGYGTINTITKYNVKIDINDKTIKIPTDLFHTSQKILEPLDTYVKNNEERNKYLKNKLKRISTYHNTCNNDDDYIKITNKNDIKVGDTVYLYCTKIKRKVISINGDIIKFDHIDFSYNIDNLIKFDIYKKSSDNTEKTDEKFIIVDNINQLKKGDIIKHERFGIGEILEIDHYSILIKFDGINRSLSKTFTIDNKLISKKQEEIKTSDEYNEKWILVNNIDELEKDMVVKYNGKLYKIGYKNNNNNYIYLKSLNKSSKIGMTFKQNQIYKEKKETKKYKNIEKFGIFEVDYWYKCKKDYKEFKNDEYYKLIEIRNYEYSTKFVINIYKDNKKIKKIFHYTKFNEIFDSNSKSKEKPVEKEKDRQITFSDGEKWSTEEVNDYIENILNIDEFEFKEEISTPQTKNFLIYLVKNSFLYQKEFYELLKKTKDTIRYVRLYKFNDDRYSYSLHDFYDKIKNNNKFID